MQYLELLLESENIKPLEESLEEKVKAILIKGVEGYEVENNDILSLSFLRWEVKVILNNENIEEIKNFILLLCNNLNIKIIYQKTVEDNTDYLNQEEHRYSIDIGNFVIFNNKEDFNKFYSPKKIPILIKQSTAFGTGQHETTSLCLESIENFFNKGYNFTNMLDLGCGSAILSIAMSKLFSGNIIATDIDELALKKAQEFIVENKAEKNITTILSNGFKEIKKQEFNLIVANILLNPLIEMRDYFYEYLAVKGYLVLSGFLDSQVENLLSFFNKKFNTIEIKEKNSWCSIVLQKK